LREYYDSLSEAIINHSGQVYQYIGDEIVITWTYEAGLKNDNCLECFFAMKNDLSDRYVYYDKEFGVQPSFKAGLHMGRVTTGEIGALKKEIIFTGDVLNATARLQGMCNMFNVDLLVSSDIMHQLSKPERFDIQTLGEKQLSGRSKPMEIYSVSKKISG
jgi:adenylate cyclase